MQRPAGRFTAWRQRLCKHRHAASLAILLAVPFLTVVSTASSQTRKAKAERATQPAVQLSLWVPAYFYPNGPGLASGIG